MIVEDEEKLKDSGSGGNGDSAESDSKHVKTDQDSGSLSAQSSSSVSDPFRVFTRDGLMVRVAQHREDLGSIERNFLSGMGWAAGETYVAAVHKYSTSGLTRLARFESFRVFLGEMARKYGGNANLRSALYGGSRDEIAQIVAHGFSTGGTGNCVQLVPAVFSLAAALSSDVDEGGLRHVLLCRVILGRKIQFVPNDSNQVGPQFDSGVDSLTNPTRFLVPSDFTNSRICPDLVISFKAPNCLNAQGSNASASRRPNITVAILMGMLGRFLSPSQKNIVCKLVHDFQAKKISQSELIRQLRLDVGDKVLAAAVKSIKKGRNE